MATFVLIHGAWHGGWCWQRLMPRLTEAGQRVIAPTLTGLGELAALAEPTVGLERHVQDILAALPSAADGPVVLVGHSYGGLVATVVADRAPERLAWLVYLDAPVPVDGQCLFDLITPSQADEFRARVARSGDGWRLAPNSPTALGLEEPADIAWAEAHLTAQPLATFTQPVRLSGAGASVPRAYLFCTPARPGSRLIEFAGAASAAGWYYREIEAGHDVMVSKPARSTAG